MRHHRGVGGTVLPKLGGRHHLGGPGGEKCPPRGQFPQAGLRQIEGGLWLAAPVAYSGGCGKDGGVDPGLDERRGCPGRDGPGDIGVFGGNEVKCAVVTGANGFVGSALLQELSTHNIKVYAIIKDRKEPVDNIQRMPGVEIIYCEMDAINTLLNKVKEQPEVFYHLAWAGSTGPLRGDYTLQLQNAKWTLDAVKVSKQLGCKRFVGAGTLAEFDVNAYTPLDGSTPNAVSCYGAAKIAAHLMSKAECNTQEIEHLWAYLSNTYGVGNYTSNFINFAAKTMLTGRPANFTSGEQPYDFVYVTDIAQGLYCIGERGKTNFAYYIGSTKPAQLKDFIYRLRDEIDPAIILNLGAIPFNGVQQPAHIFDCAQLVKDTGYQPRVPFDKGIEITVKWLRKQIKEGKI